MLDFHETNHDNMRIGVRGRGVLTPVPLLLLLLLACPGESCGPGRGSNKRRRPRKLTPLVFKQHVPNVSENTLGASGLNDGRITRNDPKFKNLVRNNNPHILFKNDERTDADQIMSQRCNDKLNILAVSVRNQWPGVKLRVTEAWDEDSMHAENSLHYEGRAVDITTSDRDRSKYGMLARLAVEAGFDWVYYETRGHIHCSVQSDSSVALKFGGCFPSSGQVTIPNGQTMSLSEVRVGQQVLALNSDGQLEFTEVIGFLDRSPDKLSAFYKLLTEKGHSIMLTPKHLIYVTDDTTSVSDDTRVTSPLAPSWKVVFAEDVKEGDVIMWTEFDSVSLSSDNNSLRIPSSVRTTPEGVISVEVQTSEGVYAPLTVHGTIVVDGFVASCYAFVRSELLAHTVLAPIRGYHMAKSFISEWWKSMVSKYDWLEFVGPSPMSCSAPKVATNETSEQDGAHWYARILYSLAINVVGMDLDIAL